ncbi:LytTR family transcriptional regulator [Clostridium tetani]|uniref:Accessory gene regulator protein A n=1 Tax=Clostridium tetani (strain Massachusetts / E88) TaxID=212717 RepID=Q897W1_CLOTE|nr:LytTR family DNA-binding domain-containing protein [Clostridium tetani]AAO35225.1 accessory gene regulator protein A [Clostridium tetani E88]RXI58367.1 LytTR family transcriptional regulator [Clostridium tetani]RXI61191.1 LytTR family transcriptional regulator [Clostridium tetani]RXI67809.1 LytTR family transcriptional regulator [Clostridium tetani]RXM54261.1 LytTR family transcriptional regulator [Clostridium tetani]
MNKKKRSYKLKYNHRYIIVLFKDINYIETIKNNRKVVLCTSNSRLEFYDILKNLSSLLDDNFIQIHRTTIINKNYIKNVCKNYNNPYVILKDDVKCILSRSGLKNVMKYWI